jgi:hypothetical protein
MVTRLGMSNQLKHYELWQKEIDLLGREISEQRIIPGGR